MLREQAPSTSGRRRLLLPFLFGLCVALTGVWERFERMNQIRIRLQPSPRRVRERGLVLNLVLDLFA